jgi:GT2 family glycosyltransferase
MLMEGYIGVSGRRGLKMSEYLLDPQWMTLASPSAVRGRVIDAAPQAVGATASRAVERLRAGAKFFNCGNRKIYLKGATYGPFAPSADGSEYHTPELVASDFLRMAAAGINAVRVYTIPPRWLLDLAGEHGLWVMVGLPWEQHVDFLETGSLQGRIERRIHEGAAQCAGHPAVAALAIGNEIPASLVRWRGAAPVERFLERLYHAAKQEDPGTLVTYVNYPSTEYLHLPFLDFASFNVYLESPRTLDGYLARLQNIAGDRPLVMAEAGLDSFRNGEERQAEVMKWQVRTAFAAGCAGEFVFAWTDEWHRGGQEILDWNFGLTDRARRPKPALESVRRAFAEVPIPQLAPGPKISVIVCTYNGSRTIGQCLNGLAQLDYGDFEVIVVDDGSTDATASIATRPGVRLIRTKNRGLSSARNTGIAAASGQIIAFIDDDAWPDPHWLTYLAESFRSTTYAGVGGPNVPPEDDGPIARAVAHAPGGPIHVLITDREAEHIPGCNMAFRADRLREIGGFDPQFRIAGDDVDLCWRMLDAGWTLGFSPAAMVWHRRRNSIKGYWTQQLNYGKAEAMLERKWPSKYNALGHVTWSGRLYDKGYLRLMGHTRRRIYHGTWGSALFQSLYQPAPPLWSALAAIPEWYLMVLVLAVATSLAGAWRPLLLAAPLLALTGGMSVVHAILAGARTGRPSPPASFRQRATEGTLVSLLHFIQPAARLRGRLAFGLTPWRARRPACLAAPWRAATTLWSERWASSERWLEQTEAAMKRCGAPVGRGGNFDNWDLEATAGLLGAVRLRLAVEEHGSGRQLVRFQWWPILSLLPLVLTFILASLAGLAAFGRHWDLVVGLLVLLLALAARTFYEWAVAAGAARTAVDRLRQSTSLRAEAAQ